MERYLNEEEIAELLLGRVSAVAAEVAGYLQQIPGMLACSTVLADIHRNDTSSGKDLWERRAAEDILLSLGMGVFEVDEDPDVLNEERAAALLETGDLDAALEAADRLLEAGSASDVDDWNRGNLLHHGHIVRGKVFLRRGDVESATMELRAAGSVPPSPQLESFGPDLGLALDLVRHGQDAAVVGFLRDVLAFWDNP